MRSIHRIVASTILVLLSAVVALSDEVTTTSGKKLAGNIVSVDKDGVAFKSGESTVKLSAKDIILIDLGNKIVGPPKDAKFTEIELTDGSIIKCSKFAIKAKKLEATLYPGPDGLPVPTFELPISSLFSVFRGADDPKLREDWKRMLSTRGKRDLYVIRQADGLNFVQGTLIEGNETGDQITFEKEDGTKDLLRLSRATGGLVFSQPANPNTPTTLCKVMDVFGNSLNAQSLEVSPSGVIVRTVSGFSVQYPQAACIAKLDYAQGNIAYLSDLDLGVSTPEPSEVDKKAFDAPSLKGMTQPAAVTKDRLPAEGALKLDGVNYPKGLCVEVDTVLTVGLNGDYREFKATVGFPDGGQSDGAELKFVVEADGQVVVSETIRGNEKPKGISRDVKGVKQLRILILRDFPSEVGNYLVIADARIQK